MLVIAGFVKSDGGPVLFAHERLGVGGRRFKCLKFRTMVADSSQVLADVLENDPVAAAEWSATQKLRNDPRITPIGRFLRNTSLDEVPQLFNILMGDMSLVGPRPIVEAEVPRYERDISFYYAARPGVTGLWQVSGRSNTTYDQRVRLDVWYVKNWSLWHDVAILMKTVPAILLRRGAV
jgi:undecaprenyl-phosphate galactose phosphotransferase